MEAARTDQEPNAPELALEQEVRLAVVLYGGVSLAIYMYGVAQELFNLVWATAPSRSYADGEPPGDLARDRVESTDAVYRELGRLLPFDGRDGADGPVRTRFVVDIVSGTSAGGINGICLAKALAGEADLSRLKDIWVDEGDIGVLINQQDAKDAKYQEVPPSSLLSGRRMLDKLVGAITGMTPKRRGPSRLVDELDLWVTATDLEGLEIPIQIANTTANERRHANRYHFRYSAVDDRDDFDGSADGFIAYAARSTSAFPFAFAPVLLHDLEALDHVPDAAWERFYSAYASAEPEFPRRAFSDGGILDNKPFSYATETLLNRYAPLPVVRKLLYMEPDPSGPHGQKPRERWNAIDTAQKAMLGLPQQDQIRADVQTVLARNRTIERVREVVAQAGGTAPEQGLLDALSQTGPAYGVYRRLKVRGVVDYLTSLVVRSAGFDPGSDEDFAVHYLVRAWKEARFAAEPGETAFLQQFDMPYRLRRVDFLLGRIKELRSTDPKAVRRVLEISRVDPAPVVEAKGRESDLIALRRDLATARRKVRQAERRLVRREGELREALGNLGIDRDRLTAVLMGRTDEGMLAKAREVASPDDFDDVAAIIRKALKTAANTLRDDITDALDAPADGREPATSLRAALRFAHNTFEAYDLPLYLVQYGTPVGETNPVDIVRVSPLEARVPDGAIRELRGLRLHHFGAFLDKRWRQHDMVWGRLDGAACLIDALLPEDRDQAKRLIEAAHRRILEEYRKELKDTSDTDVLDWFRDFEVSPYPEPERTSKALNRGAVVLSRMVEDVLRGNVRESARPVVDGVRDALIERDDAPAVEGVMTVIRSHRRFPIVIGAWTGLVIAGAVLFVLGDGWRLAGCVLLGMALALALVAIAARRAVGAAVQKALGAAREAAYRQLFPR